MKLEDIKVEQEELGAAIYIYLKPELKGVTGAVDRTVHITKTDVAVDLTEDGDILGFEIS